MAELQSESLVKTHRVIANLDYGALGRLAQIIASHVRNGTSRRVVRSELEKILVGAIADGTLRMEDLQDEVKQAIHKATTSQ